MKPRRGSARGRQPRSVVTNRQGYSVMRGSSTSHSNIAKALLEVRANSLLKALWPNLSVCICGFRSPYGEAVDLNTLIGNANPESSCFRRGTALDWQFGISQKLASFMGRHGFPLEVHMCRSHVTTQETAHQFTRPRWSSLVSSLSLLPIFDQ